MHASAIYVVIAFLKQGKVLPEGLTVIAFIILLLFFHYFAKYSNPSHQSVSVYYFNKLALARNLPNCFRSAGEIPQFIAVTLSCSGSLFYF